jgi:hypothetical protein
VPSDKAGVGSAVLNSSRQVGGSIGIALMGSIMAHEIGGSRAQAPEPFVHGLSVALLVAAGIAVAGAVVALTTIRSHAGPEAAPRSSDRETETVRPIVQPSDATVRSGR